MTDLTLRQRERTSRNNDDPASQALLLVAQIRAGDLNSALVQLHAELGDPVARLVYPMVGDQPNEVLVRSLCSEPEHGLAYDDHLWGRMCYVPAGVSVVGLKDDDTQAYDDEKPQHLVYTEAFWLAQYPATLEQWQSAGGTGGAQVSGGQAVVSVSWNDCQETLKQASAQAGSSYRVYRGGCWNNEAGYCRAANRYRYEPSFRLAVLGFRPARAVPQDSTSPRALRGGSWFNATRNCRASSRNRYEPGVRDDHLGFRVALSSPQDSSLPSAVLPSYRLPLEDEFERAARGWDGRVYPWGDKWIEDRAKRLGTPSPWGIYGLCGETWLWTQDAYVADRRPLIQQEEKIK